MPIDQIEAAPTSILSGLKLPRHTLDQLQPEVRDRLLAYVSDWGEPRELLELAEQLRETHGPLLFLLDYEAEALIALER